MTPEDISSIHDFDEFDNTPAQRIKVIGVGGGGNNAVNHMFNKGIKDVSFVLINTDKQALEQSSIPTRIVIGPGRGAGGRPERAKEYAEASATKIEELFDDDTDMVFITAGMGGGTGTGAAPVVARIAKELGILTVGIVTIPFFFEGKKKVAKALEGAQEMSKNVDALLMINNERLTEIYSDLDIFNAFAKADDTLLNAAQGITEIITIPGIINRDFNDVDTTLREGGTAIISSGYGEGENRVEKAIQDALHSPLLRNTDIFGSKKLLMVLYVSDDPQYPFEMSEANQLTDFVSNIDSDVDVMWGLYKIPGLEGKVKITILASGFDVTVDENTPRPIVDTKKIESEKAVNQLIEKEYGKEAADALNRRASGVRTKVLNPEDLDNDEAIAEAETVAFKRNRPNVSSSFNSTLRNNINAANNGRAASTQKGTEIDFGDLN
jgi:cell division protein FtsZ